ncbi:MAG TPA: ABC transporter permease [Actinomycetota bacterium]|nr:ABC transporter permease [Actinomycetota bacterium]
MTAIAARVVHANALAYKRLWKGSVITAFVNPLLFLVAMGQGLGSLVERGTAGIPAGVEYLEFIAPGLLAAAAFQTAAGESTWPVMGGFKWQKNYHAALATPIGIRELVTGTLVWIGIRTLMTCIAFASIAIVVGAIPWERALIAIFPALLTGIAIAAPLMGYTPIAKAESRLATIFRFVVIPMFLFSGTFFPIEQLPDWLEPVAYATPLWHGVDMCRAIALGIESTWPVLAHVGFLAVWAGLGYVWARKTFPKVLYL